MKEAEENTLRNLLTRMRQEDPTGFVNLVIDVMLARVGDNQIILMDRFDADDIRDSTIVVGKGVGAAARLTELTAEYRTDDADDTGDGEPA